MARTTRRSSVRRSLPALLALLLAFALGAHPAPASTDPATRGTAASTAAGWSSSTLVADPAGVADPACAPVEPEPAPVEASSTDPVAVGRERVLRTQLARAVRAARAPPTTLS
ncbi:hypothetical protein ACWKSP_14555 [Micromonosporaceae bacterium Da 78-11]